MPSQTKSQRTFMVLGVILVLGAGITKVGESFFVGSARSKAVLAQRVEADKTAGALFGDSDPDAYRPLGSPQKFVIDDPKAFLTKDGPDGVKRLDDGYLKSHNIYPTQLKTIEFTGELVEDGAAVAFVVGIITILVCVRARNKGVALTDSQM